VQRILARGEAIKLCKAALAEGPMNTRQLAQHVMEAKGLDLGDKVLAKAVAGRLIHGLRQQWRRELINGDERHRGVRVWKVIAFDPNAPVAVPPDLRDERIAKSEAALIAQGTLTQAKIGAAVPVPADAVSLKG
jgi:hypothetical protein